MQKPEPAFTFELTVTGCTMLTETVSIASAGHPAISCESRASAGYVAWRERSAQRLGLLYLLRLREHRRSQELRKKMTVRAS
ncbi:MAG TPA: hypothetical protein VGH19_05550 [Verrucomicrobiae bacterium]